MEYIETDPFIDLAFVQPLISNDEWYRVIERQATIYTSTGDLGENTATYSMYKLETPRRVISEFKNVYKHIDRGSMGLSEALAEDKMNRAWRALIALLALRHLIVERAGLEMRELLPEVYTDLRALAGTINALIKAKTGKEGAQSSSSPTLVKKVLGKSKEEVLETAPLVWWINLVMESKVFEAIFKFHYLVRTKKEILEKLVDETEQTLSEIEGHEPDHEYTKFEIFKALLSRCVELRGQYINKLQNAILFVKTFRVKVKNTQEWRWFIDGDVLTYVASVYISEAQKLVSSKRVNFGIPLLIAPRSGAYAGAASALAALILLSPVLMQYSIEARETVAVTPADVLVALLRLAKKRDKGGDMEDFSVDIDELAGEILQFWKDTGIYERIKRYTEYGEFKGPISPEESLKSPYKSISTSLALLIHTKVEGVHVVASKRTAAKLPPTMEEYDTIYVRPRYLNAVVRRVWEV
ncbi:hypothetical protein [Infirmifilum sp.]|uniref:hypothetical protein n=1 Tax=Infirmifilum sp. TaxID=2856575 RepID=UPI003D12B812